MIYQVPRLIRSIDIGSKLLRLNKLDVVLNSQSCWFKPLIVVRCCSSSSPQSQSTIKTNFDESGQSDDKSIEKDDDKLIYVGPLVDKIKSVKLLSLTTSVFGFTGQTYIYSKSLEDGSTISTFTLIFTSTVILLFSLTPLLINSITKRYVYQLYFNPNDCRFTAYTLNFINRPVVTHFDQSNLKLAPVASPFTTIMVNKKPLFVDIKDIKDPDALELFAKVNVQ